MDTAHVKYLGGLRTEAVHLRSGEKIITDAPVGIAAEARSIQLNGLQARVVKHMASGPRRVERIEVHFELDGKELDDKQRSILEHAARTCPVALSLREELVQEVTFTYH